MRDEPTGRYVVRQTGKPVTAKRFHFYRDCGLIKDLKPPHQEVIDLGLDDNDVSLFAISTMGLTPCQPCENRSKEVSALDVIADTLCGLSDSDGGIVAILGGASDHVRAVIDTMFGVEGVTTEIATRVISDLEKNGYAIRRIKKGGPH